MEDRDSLIPTTAVDAGDEDGPEPALPTFDRPDEPFALGDELGRGGMGRVVAATDRALGRPVAIKQALSRNPDNLRRFEREARITARLEHPSIVPVHETGRDGDGNPFYVMRRIAGEPLHQRIAEARDMRALLALVPNVLAAVDAAAFAHARGVIHRDIKPTNILVGKYGETLLIDWGLARELGDRDLASSHGAGEGDDGLTQAGDVFGTPGYMAPEQARGEAVDKRADVYALGATLFHVVAGEPPFTGKVVQYVAEVATGWLPPFDKIHPEVPRELVTIVAKAMALDPARRYRDAGELAADLRAFLAGNLVAAHRYTPAERFARFVRRHRAAVAVAGLAALALIAGGTVALYRVVGAERAARTRADQLLVAHAHGVLAEDPIRAVALLGLSDRLRDAEAWAVSVEAVWRGLPQVWRAHDTAVISMLVLDDGSVASGSHDGELVLRQPDGRIQQLAQHMQSISDIVAVPGGFAVGGDGRIARYASSGVKLAEWPAGRQLTIVAAGGWLVARDEGGSVARELATGRTVQLAANKFTALAIDPAGRHVALADAEGARVVELATGALRTLAPSAQEVAWSPNGERLVVGVPGAILTFQSSDWTQPVPPRPVAWAGLGYIGNSAVWVDGHLRCVWLVDSGQLEACVDGLLRIWNGPYVISGDGRTLTLHDGPNATPLGSAPGKPLVVSLDPRGRRVAMGAQNGRVALWDLEARSTESRPLSMAFAYYDGNTLLADRDGTIVRLERGGVAAPIVEVGDLDPSRVFAAIGHWIVALDASQLTVATPGQPPVTQRDITAFARRGDHEIVARHRNGALGLVDLATGSGRELVKHDGEPGTVHGSDGDGVVVATWLDGLVWWLDPQSQQHTVNVGCRSQAAVWAHHGLEVACNNELFAWRGGLRERLATLPAHEQISGWGDAGGIYAVVSAEGGVWRVEPGATQTQLLADDTNLIALADERFASVDRSTGAVYIHDIRSGARAQIGVHPQAIQLAISEDGRSVAVFGAARMLRWDDPSPRDPAQWPAWRASLTPARLDEPNAALVWP